MPLKCGIVGLPNVGKSTFFGCVSKREGLSANFPFSTIAPNVAVVQVPDERLHILNKYVATEKITPTTVCFVDIAGLVEGASKGEGLGNQFLANIREVDALVHVVRCFDDDNVVHVAGGVDPVFDQEVINQELRFADVATLNKRSVKVGKLAKTGQRDAVQEKRLIEKYLAALEGGKDARYVLANEEEKEVVCGWQLLTSKPVIYVANVDEAALSLSTRGAYVEALSGAIAKETQLLPICLDLEAQIVALPDDEQQAYVAAYGLTSPGLNKVIKAVYDLLGLMTFFTVGKQEIRAWTVGKGTAAPQAAGVIHTDFEKNFIKAEVIKYADFIHYHSEEKCRQAGKMAIEGKSYEVVDGDIIHFKCR